jgi:Protein of unknown function (DUF3631)
VSSKRDKRAVKPRFGDRERGRLEKMFRQLGTDNRHEADAARSAIDNLLRQFGKSWADLIELLGGRLDAIGADLASSIVALGSGDEEERQSARRTIADLLARHRKTWNDLADALCSASGATWAGHQATDDPPRVNPLTLVDHLLRDYLAMQEHEYVAGALWCLHTHVYDRFLVTPRLAIRSPVADCGKTTLLDVIARLAARPAKFDSITTAAIFRLTDDEHPTLLIGEADNLGIAMQPNGRLRAVFNSGHRKDGAVAIMERGGLRRFSTFAPLALALPDIMFGLPRTLNSRAITITMQRYHGQRPLQRFQGELSDPALDAAYGQILLWRNEAVLDPDPEMPAGLRNRFADNWRPLISIADSLGWGAQAREAMLVFSREFKDADIKILLLGDIRKAFDARKEDRLPTKTLLADLHALGDSDWPEFRGLRGDQQPHKLRDTEMASMLREFGIRPRAIWPANRTAASKSTKGYRRSQFEDVWAAYCSEDVTASHPSGVRNLWFAGDGTA